MAEIVTFGEVAAEFMAQARNQPLGEPGLFAGPFPGGAPAIFIDQAARLDAHAAFVSAVGTDAFGAMLSARLAADGVDVTAIAALPDRPTATAFVTYRDDGSRDFLFNFANAACADIQASQFDGVIDGCKLFHIAGSTLFSDHMIGLARQLAARVRSAGGSVSFDPNIRKQTLAVPGMRAALAELLTHTSILLPSDDELAVLTRCDDEAQALQSAFDCGVEEVVLKRGSAGASYHARNAGYHVAGLVADEVDPTGAGDCFGATFCTLRSQGMAAREALMHANAAGAIAVSRRGAMEGTSCREELQSLLTAQPA